MGTTRSLTVDQIDGTGTVNEVDVQKEYWRTTLR